MSEGQWSSRNMKFPVVFTQPIGGTVWYGVACCQKLGQMLGHGLDDGVGVPSCWCQEMHGRIF